MSSMEVISRWMWSRSNGVMNVLCSSVMVSWVILSAARSAASMRRACASSSLNVPIIDASSRLPSTMRSAWALNRSKNLPSRGIRRPSIVIPLSRGPAILAVSLRRCRIPSRRAPERRLPRARAARRAALRECARSAAPVPAARRRRRLRSYLSRCFGMAARLRPAKHRREAGIRPLEDPAPLVARFRFEGFRELFPHLRPASAVMLRDDFANLQFGKQLLEKLVLDGADGNVFAILGFVDVVPGRAGVEDIAGSLLRPVIGGKETREHRG